ncbi:MAG TPA: phosphoribosyltransferase family protein [Vicinamibacterales bacterium]|nr:phosphoribosyltransferase family protein [Vicinamibacterales bacterium]
MQVERFHDRADAGRRLAARLEAYAGQPGVHVFGLARGGVPVAFEVAMALGAPLDVLAVRKIGAPGQPELAVGALAPGGVRVLNDDLVRSLGVTPALIDRIAAREWQALTRQERMWRGDRPRPDLRNGTVILIDDGLATGASMRAAIAWARHQEAARVVVAVPVAAPATMSRLRREADEIVAVAVPAGFSAVGEWYDDFSQTSDAEVTDRLARAAGRPA